MTDAQKKMKQYVNAVERRLNMPRDIKARVMSDFTSSIQARRESGMTEEEIYSELGSAQKVAAELNEQMKEFAYRKSPWRFLFAALAAYGVLDLVIRIWGQIAFWLMQAEFRRESFSVGVIGGADGPTAVFVTTPGWVSFVFPVVLVVVGVWGFLRLRKCRK